MSKDKIQTVTFMVMPWPTCHKIENKKSSIGEGCTKHQLFFAYGKLNWTFFSNYWEDEIDTTRHD